MLSYAVHSNRLEITAIGTISGSESAAMWQRIREDSAVPAGLGLLLDARQHDTGAVALGDVQARIARMAEILGPKIDRYWAIVIDHHLDQLAKGRLVQDMTHLDKTVMLFHDVAEAREWLDAMVRQLP